MGRLLWKSDIFRKFYDSERPKIAKALYWVEEPALPEGITGRETSDESGAHVIRLRRVPAAVRDAWLIAHELGHAVIDEKGFPVTGVRDLRLEPLSSALNSMIHDPLVDAGLLGAYGLDLKAKFREEAAEARRNLEELAEEPRGLGRVHWVFNYTSTIIDFGLAYGDVDPGTDEFVSWFQNRYPSVAAEARNLVEQVRAMGYETLAQAVTLLRAIVERYEISGRVFVFYGLSDEEVAVHES